MIFKKIKVNNNWENLTYFRGKKEISPGEYTCHVEWPDKSVTEERVVSHPHHTTVHDHGHSYKVATHKFFIETSFHGLEVRIPLESVRTSKLTKLIKY